MNKNVIVMAAIAAVVITVGVILAVTTYEKPVVTGEPVDGQSLVRSDSHRIGPKDAKVTIVEFGDFQCPACAAINPIVKQVMENNKEKSVAFVYRNFPLRTIHRNAEIAAQSAEAAAAQGKYWEMHNKLFETQSQWENTTEPLDIFAQYASELGLNVDEFKTGVSSKKFADIVQAGVEDGTKLDVQSTPTFYLNGEKLDKNPNLEEWQAKIDEALAK